MRSIRDLTTFLLSLSFGSLSNSITTFDPYLDSSSSSSSKLRKIVNYFISLSMLVACCSTYDPISVVRTLYSGSVQLDIQSQTNPNLLKPRVFSALNIS